MGVEGVGAVGVEGVVAVVVEVERAVGRGVEGIRAVGVAMGGHLEGGVGWEGCPIWASLWTPVGWSFSYSQIISKEENVFRP